MVTCRCGAEMRCEENEVRVTCRDRAFYADLYVCETCGKRAAHGFGKALKGADLEGED